MKNTHYLKAWKMETYSTLYILIHKVAFNLMDKLSQLDYLLFNK